MIWKREHLSAGNGISLGLTTAYSIVKKHKPLDKTTEGWVVRNISDFSIIHLASHGDFDPVIPVFPSAKLVRDDGDLRASEIFGLNIQTGLVMLSACQTGLGRITSGYDMIGVNRAFLYVGTNAIMSSLWRISDISTALLVK